MNQNTSAWLHGLFAALIGGGASAVVSGITVSAIDPATFNFRNNFLHMAELTMLLFLTNGLLSAFAFLKQSPLPAESVTVTQTKTSTVEVTKDGQ